MAGWRWRRDRHLKHFCDGSSGGPGCTCTHGAGDLLLVQQGPGTKAVRAGAGRQDLSHDLPDLFGEVCLGRQAHIRGGGQVKTPAISFFAAHGYKTPLQFLPVSDLRDRSVVDQVPHKHRVVGSIPAPATIFARNTRATFPTPARQASGIAWRAFIFSALHWLFKPVNRRGRRLHRWLAVNQSVRRVA